MYLRKNLNKISVFIYYAVLMAILLSWTSPDVAPPQNLRYAFLVAVAVPLLFDGTLLTLSIISIFYTVSYYGYSFSYMPQSIILYLAILIICIIINKNKISYHRIEGWQSFIIFGIYIIFLNTVTSFAPLLANGDCVLFCLFFPFFLFKNKKESIKILEHSFIIIAIIMSIQYLLIGDQAILVQNQDGSGLARTGWTDPNYYASIIGMGVVVSVMLLMELKERTLFSTIYYGSAILLSIIVVLLNASRGASAAIALSILILLFVSKVKSQYKILISVLIIVMFVGLDYYGYFDLLKVRVAAGDATAGGRTTIWGIKLNAFLAMNNPIAWIFGIGFEEGFVLGFNYPRSFHSDYVCTLVDYGLVGFTLFITMLIMPVRKAPRRQRPIIFALSAYLWIIGFSLCPLTEGFVPYYFFLFYIFAKMQVFREQENMS